MKCSIAAVDLDHAWSCKDRGFDPPLPLRPPLERRTKKKTTKKTNVKKDKLYFSRFRI